jgi:proteasome assembly chaperone (PAC2) family protein
MSERVVIEERPELTSPTLVAAFAGWPDAGEVASASLRYLLRKLRPRRFARIEPEDFYDFTNVRPYTRLVTPWQRELHWPENEFHYWRRGEGSDLVLFLGREPNLRWKAYTHEFLSVAEACGVRRVLTLGGNFDTVPHTGEPKLSGAALDGDFRGELEGLGLRASTYQGPTSIHSALLDGCRRRGIAAGSLWGHAPHYLQAAPNVKVCYGMLRKLKAWLDLPLELGEMRGAARALEARVDQLLADNRELQEYVRRLEAGAESDEARERGGEQPGLMEMPSPEAVVRELEEFLRQQQREGEEDAPPSS